MKTFGLWRRSAASLIVTVSMMTALPCGCLWAQAPSGPDTTSSTTEDSTGKVTAVSGTTISLTSRRGPFTYRLGQDLHVIGPKNERLQIGDVHPGQEATLYYYQRDGEPTVARIVLIREADESKSK